MPQREREQPARLSASVCARVAGFISAGRTGGLGVAGAFAKAWDEGFMEASLRSWWRIAARMRREQATVEQATVEQSGAAGERAVARVKPQVLATGANQVWAWDITDLPTAFRGVAFKAYAIIDIFSRKVIVASVHQRESTADAMALFMAAIAAEGGCVPQVVHADNGAVMRSNLLNEFLTEHGIEVSHSRPRVSNDNPYIESEFRTLKNRASYPGVFASLVEASTYVAQHVHWYNHAHHHSGIALYTPAQVHDGSWKMLHARRQVSLAYYQARHPERFRGHRAPVPAPKAWAGINHPGPE